MEKKIICSWVSGVHGQCRRTENEPRRLQCDKQHVKISSIKSNISGVSGADGQRGRVEIKPRMDLSMESKNEKNSKRK